MTENTLGTFFKLGGVAGLLAAMGRGSACDMKHDGVNSGWVAGVFAMVLMILGFVVPSSAAAVSCAALGCEVVWVDDALPIGSSKNSEGSVITYDAQWKYGRYDNEPFDFVANPITAGYTGTSVHQSPKPKPKADFPLALWRQHFFYTSPGFMVGANDTLFTYVYLDPIDPPSEIMLQWHGPYGWEHRAYWAAQDVNSIPWGADGTNARRYMGVLPPVGQWVRLEVPASAVGLRSATSATVVVTGMAYVAYDGGTVNNGGGTVTWGRSGTVISATAPVNPTPPQIVPLPEVRPSSPTLSVSPVSTTPSGPVITATWANYGTPSSTDWLGLYRVGAPDDESYIDWCYPTRGRCVKALLQERDITAMGSAPFSLPSTLANGTYELRLYSNNVYRRLTQSLPFCIGC